MVALINHLLIYLLTVGVSDVLDATGNAAAASGDVMLRRVGSSESEQEQKPGHITK